MDSEELEQARRNYREVSSRLESTKHYMVTLERELFSLSVDEKLLIENLSILKRDGTIASLAEYKKIKEELSKIQNRLVFVRADHSNYSKILVSIEKSLIEYGERYDRLMNTPVGKILQGKFGEND